MNKKTDLFDPLKRIYRYIDNDNLLYYYLYFCNFVVIGHLFFIKHISVVMNLFLVDLLFLGFISGTVISIYLKTAGHKTDAYTKVFTILYGQILFLIQEKFTLVLATLALTLLALVDENRRQKIEAEKPRF